MSTPQPPRRRRIAGESKPGPSAAKASVVKKAAKVRPTTRQPQQKTPPPKPPAPEASRATVTGTPPETTEAPSRGLKVPRVSGRLDVLVALTVVALAFGAVFGVKGFLDWRDESGIVDAHEKAATTAATAGETIFTYQYNDLDGHLKDAKDTMTPSFAKKFESIAPALRELAPQRKIQVKATVRNAAPEACGTRCRPDRATVLVFYDQARVADGEEKPTVFGNRMELSMVEQDGRWLVNNIEAL